MTIREQIVFKRNQIGLSIPELSKRTDISSSMLYKYEQGGVNLGEDNLRKVFKHLNLKIILIDNELLK